MYKISNKTNFRQLLSTSILVLTAAFTVSSCASHPTTADNRDPSQVMSELSSRIQDAQSQQVALLSPQDFSKAKAAYEEADKARMKSEPDNQEVLSKASESKAWMTKAEKNASISKISLSSAIDARQDAIDAGANTYFKEDFKNADDRFTDLTKDVEDGNLGNAKDNQANVANDYAHLEKRAVYRRYASGPKQSLDSAQAQGAKKWAPDLYKDSDAKYQELSKAIEANPRDTQNIEQLSVVAKQSADQLLKTTEDSKYLASLTPEERARKLQDQQSQISSLQGSAQGSAAEASAYKEQTTNLQKQTAMSQKIKDIQKNFTSEEAEVYQQGDNVIIRLKGIEFPKAGSEIPSRNFQLLNKVASAIKDFGPQAKVIVAGSTDSTGGKQLNQKLSEKRADSVKNFLVAKEAAPENQIETSGLGASKPIASNKTAEGRQANRRVDVTIEPQATS